MPFFIEKGRIPSELLQCILLVLCLLSFLNMTSLTFPFQIQCYSFSSDHNLLQKLKKLLKPVEVSLFFCHIN